MKSTLWTLLGVVGLIIVVAVAAAHWAPPQPPLAEVPTATAPATSPAPTLADSQDNDPLPPQRQDGLESVQGDANRIKRVAVACWSWAQSHQLHMPDSLADLVAAHLLSPADLVTGRTGTAALSLSPAALADASKDHDALARLLEPHCDYVYLGKGLTPDELKQNAITQQVAILYEKPSAKLQGRMNIGYIDGHIQIRLISRLPYALRLSNDFPPARAAH